MNAYPYRAWTWGNVSCEARPVVIVDHSRFGDRELDAKGNAYERSELFAAQRGALEAIARYLDRKQAEIDRQQAILDRQRKTLKQQQDLSK